MSNSTSRLLLCGVLLGSLLSLPAQPAAPAPPTAKANSSGGNSPHETTSATIGGRNGPRVTLTYGRPLAKGRVVWGTLVPWNAAWRLGSDEATTLITQQPMVIGETTIPAGVYTLYMVPSEKGVSKLAFSSALGKWGIPVDETKDIARVELKKSSVDTPVEQLTLAIENDAATGGSSLKISWATTQFALPFTLKK